MDVVEGGTPRRTGRAWGVAALAAVVALAVVALRHDGGTPRATPSPTPTPSVSTSEPPLVGSFGPPSPAPSLATVGAFAGKAPVILVADGGLVLRHPPGEVAPTRLRSIDVGPHTLLSVPTGTIVVRGDVGSALKGDPPSDVWFVPFGEDPVLLGAANDAVVARDPAFVWLTTYDDSGPAIAGTARRVDLATARVRETVRLPGSAYLQGETTRGFVLSGVEHDAGAVLWDRRTRKETASLQALAVGTTATTLLLQPFDCNLDCLDVYDVASGSRKHLGDLGGSLSGPPALSPGGTEVAAYVASPDGTMSLVVVNVRSGVRTTPDGSTLDRATSAVLTWSRDGRVLVVALGGGEKGQVLAYSHQEGLGLFHDYGAASLATE